MHEIYRPATFVLSQLAKNMQEEKQVDKRLQYEKTYCISYLYDLLEKFW